MEEFNFEIVLNYRMECFDIKPPTSYQSLIEIAKEKYDLNIIRHLGYFEEDEDNEIKIAGESDYLALFDYVEAKKLNSVSIVIKSDEQKGKRKKSIRKSSKAHKPSVTNQKESNSGCINGNVYNLY